MDCLLYCWQGFWIYCWHRENTFFTLLPGVGSSILAYHSPDELGKNRWIFPSIVVIISATFKDCRVFSKKKRLTAWVSRTVSTTIGHGEPVRLPLRFPQASSVRPFRIGRSSRLLRRPGLPVRWWSVSFSVCTLWGCWDDPMSTPFLAYGNII